MYLFLFTTCSCPQCILSYACGRFPLLFSASTCHVSCLSSVFFCLKVHLMSASIMVPVLF